MDQPPSGSPSTGVALTRVAALLMALGVALAAFGAHALQDHVTPQRLETWRTATRFHLVHGLALLVLARMPSPPKATAWLLGAGIALFSGSLYLLVLTDTGWLGAITPLGGLSFIAGWGILAWKGPNA